MQEVSENAVFAPPVVLWRTKMFKNEHIKKPNFILKLFA
jgi:hypothetical protein